MTQVRCRDKDDARERQKEGEGVGGGLRPSLSKADNEVSGAQPTQRGKSDCTPGGIIRRKILTA